MAFKQVELSTKLSDKQVDLDIAVRSFNDGNLSKDELHRMLRTRTFKKRGYGNSDTQKANSIILIYKDFDLQEIQHIQN